MIPSYKDYGTERDLAVTFENKILYQMCIDEPTHKARYVVSGKLVAIGRIYAAPLERGAGEPKPTGTSLIDFVAEHLVNSSLDKLLGDISYSCRIDDPQTYDQVVSTHKFLVEQICRSTTDWDYKARKEGWKVRSNTSFASKYLHFHRPNAFPIMDSIARTGLNSEGHKVPFGNYGKFCRAVLDFAKARQDSNWTPRGIDTELLTLGRKYQPKKRKVASKAPQC